MVSFTCAYGEEVRGGPCPSPKSLFVIIRKNKNYKYKNNYKNEKKKKFLVLHSHNFLLPRITVEENVIIKITFIRLKNNQSNFGFIKTHL